MLLAAALSACAPRRLQLPSGDGEPFPSFPEASREATAGCRDVRTIAAELGISGSAGGQKLRGRATAGIAAPDSIRLEGTAPFGPPVFILAADGARATLLLPRDNRVASGESPAAILDALVGLDLGPADLLSILTGCVVPDPHAVAGRWFSGNWARIDLADGSSLYLQRDGRQRWRVRAGSRRALRIEYEGDGPGLPTAVRVTAAGDAPASDIRLALSQVEVNGVARPRRVSREDPLRRPADLARRVASGGPDGGEAMKLRACAKINRSLLVRGLRPDGYHDLETVFQSLALHDTLEFAEASEGMTIACLAPGVPLDERNLVWKAARLVWQAAGRAGEPVGRVAITKRIPAQGGLGGGSANGAASLVGWNRLWGAGLSPDSIQDPGAGPGCRRAVLPGRRHRPRPGSRGRHPPAGGLCRRDGWSWSFRPSGYRRPRHSAGGTRTIIVAPASVPAIPVAPASVPAIRAAPDFPALATTSKARSPADTPSSSGFGSNWRRPGPSRRR